MRSRLRRGGAAGSRQPGLAPGAPRLAAVDALREARFRPLWYAGLCINSARWLDFLLLGWVTLELTNSPLMVGVAAFVKGAPVMLFGLFAGLLADRVPRGRLLIAVHSVNLAVALALAVMFASGQASFPLLLALETLLGLAWVIDYPARRTIISNLVSRPQLTNAVSLETMSQQGTKMSGPLLGGILLGQVGPVGGYLAFAVLQALGLILIVVLVRRTRLPAVSVGESVLAGLATGVREVRSQPLVLGVLAITLVMNLLMFPYQQMWSVLARDVLRVGPELLGLLVAADGLGGLAGGLLLASRREFGGHRQVFAIGSLCAALLVIGLALSPWYPLSFAVQFALGMAESGFATMQTTIPLLVATERARGRVMGIVTACVGTGPLGALWIGFAASQVGAPLAMAAGGVIGLLLMWPVALRLFLRPGGEPRRELSAS